METNEFVVKSMRHCFICLNQIPSHPIQNMDQNQISEHGPIYFLRSLSRYLKMDMGAVFNENERVPRQLLDKVRKAKLKGEMCLECALLNEAISEKYQNLVKIELELVSSLKEVQSKLLAANAAHKTTTLRQLADTPDNSKDDWRGKLDILDALRTETIQKCSRKLNTDAPRVKVANLTPDRVITEKLKFQSNSLKYAKSHGRSHSDSSFRELPVSNNLQCEYGAIKAEHPSEDSIPDWDNDIQTPNYSVELKTVTNNPNHQRNLKDEGNAKSFVEVIPPTSSKIAKPEATFNPETGKYKCHICPTERSSMTEINIHYKSVHLKVKYKCTLCGSQFTQRGQYNLHHRTIHLGIRFKCLVCNKIFTQKSNLSTHQRNRRCGRTVLKTETG